MSSKKSGLGKGLNDLFAMSTEEDTLSNEIALSDIQPNPNQPRTDINEEKIDELAQSIKTKGLIEPIVVRRIDGGKYEIIAGERRWHACNKLAMKTIPAIVRDVDDQEAMELALIENLHRDDLNAIEEARGYKRLIQVYKLKQSEVAEQVSKSRSAVANSLRLLDLPEELQQYIYDGKMTAGHARAILGLSDDEARIKLGNKVVNEGLTVRETENLVRLLATGEKAETKRRTLPQSYKAAAKVLRGRLHTDVRVTTSGGKNKIVIAFNDEEDLQRICDQLEN